MGVAAPVPVQDCAAGLLRPMRVTITDPSYTDDLVDFLRRCECTSAVVGPGVLDVETRELPVDPALRHSELELDAYLGIWSALREAKASLAA